LQNRFLGGVFWLLGAFFTFRIFYSAFAEQGLSNFMLAGPVHMTAFLVMTVGGLLVLIGLVFLNAQRLSNDVSQARQEVRQLTGLLPICANCKKIRDDSGDWQRLEEYIQDHSEADFTHSICPECARELYPELHRNKN
jgi:hypothetical protein